MDQNLPKSLQIVPINLFNDNFSYLILGSEKNKGALVDPADADTIINFLKKYPHLQISHVLFTHKHADHIGYPDGPEKLRQLLVNYNKKSESNKLDNIEYVLHKDDSKDVKQVTLVLTEKTNYFELNGVEVMAQHAPCHTRGHLLYNLDLSRNQFQPQFSQEDLQIIKENDAIETKNCLFTGDTLFIGGAGRFFEGNAKEMLENMDFIASLPDDVHILCGHEYTFDNYKWGKEIEPDNEQIQIQFKRAQELKEQKKRSIPSTVLQEKQANVFMRCRETNFQKFFDKLNPEQIMAKIREMKNKGQTMIDVLD